MAIDAAQGGLADAPRQPLAITLVHGTWGQGVFPHRGNGRRWFEADGSFRKRLVASFVARDVPDVAVSAHLWSGANSLWHRDTAAIELAAKLDQQLAERPDALRLVVAHSHGGNVALRSFAYLKRDPAGITVVTLATPFLELFRSNAPAYRWITPGDLLIALVVCLTIIQKIVFRTDVDTQARHAPKRIVRCWMVQRAAGYSGPI